MYLVLQTSLALEKLEDEKSKFQDQKRKLEEDLSLENQSNEHRKTQLSMVSEKILENNNKNEILVRILDMRWETSQYL